MLCLADGFDPYGAFRSCAECPISNDSRVEKQPPVVETLLLVLCQKGQSKLSFSLVYPETVEWDHSESENLCLPAYSHDRTGLYDRRVPQSHIVTRNRRCRLWK